MSTSETPDVIDLLAGVEPRSRLSRAAPAPLSQPLAKDGV